MRRILYLLIFIFKLIANYHVLKSIKVFAIDIDGTLTENGGGIIHLPAAANLRHLERLGYNVIFVTGRSSIEAYFLSVFCGTTKVAVGENGGALTTAPNEHILLASREKCLKGFEVLKRNIEGVQMKSVFTRLTEVVLFRTFDIENGRKILEENSLALDLSDSKYAFHINEKGINKATGLIEALKILKATPEETVAIGDSETDVPLFDICGYSVALNHAADNVKSRAKYVVKGKEGNGLIDAIQFVVFSYIGARNKK